MTWAEARRLALDILHRAEARRRELVEKEARFYTTEDLARVEQARAQIEMEESA